MHGVLKEVILALRALAAYALFGGRRCVVVEFALGPSRAQENKSGSASTDVRSNRRL
jgi:hypothetical protein